jgi:predicted ATPase/DNA-binding winged helix-turn-helix (wHTH) protein
LAADGRALVYACGVCEVDLGGRELRVDGNPVPIGGRAFDVLEVLVRAAGAIVTKDDFMGGVWAGAIVEENTLQVHISTIRKALGPERGLLKTASGRGYRLLGDWTPHWDAAPAAIDAPETPVHSTPPPSGNLPLAWPDLIGRERAKQDLLELSRKHRVVTLTGPGGIGKTALAVAVARDLLGSFSGDAWVVDLATITRPELVPSAVAGVLSLTLGDEVVSPVAVARAIGPRRTLIVLDNCERVIDAAANLAEAIVSLCSRASIFATSRELLRIAGEMAFIVPPLDVPDAALRRPAELLNHSAVKLFIAKVQSSRPEFVPDDSELIVAASICRRLDGIPLAIEFGAARAATLGLENVLSRLDERFKLLTVGRRTALPRHQTLRATLDWSYQFMPGEEQALLRSLGVFPAGFTLEAAAAVMSDADDIATDMGNLVAKSLVAMDRGGSGRRWHLLETTRAYALENLAALGESEQAARRHATFFRDLFTRHQDAAKPSPVGERMALFLSEIDNVRAALDWAFSSGGDPALGIALTASFIPAWLHLSLMVECRERITVALSHLQAQANLSARVGMNLHIALGLSLVYTTGLVTRTEEVLRRALELAESLDDPDNQLLALSALWLYHLSSGELRRAREFGDQFFVVARKSGDRADLALADQILGYITHFQGSQPEARGYLENVLAVYSSLGERPSSLSHPDVRIPVRATLGRVLLLQGLVDQARQFARASLNEEMARGRPISICNVLRYGVCVVAFATGDLGVAEQATAVLTDLAQSHGFAFWTRIGRCLEGALLIRRGDLAAGTASLRTALATVRNRPPDLLGVLAEGLAGLGLQSEAIATLDERLERSEKTTERWFDAELLRIKGEVLMDFEAHPYAAQAEACFEGAILLARRQGALLWELRACRSLGRLQVRDGRQREAYEQLTAVYSKFSEGLETDDLRLTKSLIDAIRSGPAETLQNLSRRRNFGTGSDAGYRGASSGYASGRKE